MRNVSVNAAVDDTLLYGSPLLFSCLPCFLRVLTVLVGRRKSWEEAGIPDLDEGRRVGR